MRTIIREKKKKKRCYDDLESIGVLEFGYMLRPYE